MCVYASSGASRLFTFEFVLAAEDEESEQDEHEAQSLDAVRRQQKRLLDEPRVVQLLQDRRAEIRPVVERALLKRNCASHDFFVYTPPGFAEIEVSIFNVCAQGFLDSCNSHLLVHAQVCTRTSVGTLKFLDEILV